MTIGVKAGNNMLPCFDGILMTELYCAYLSVVRSWSFLLLNITLHGSSTALRTHAVHIFPFTILLPYPFLVWLIGARHDAG
jgi:hypothetical protein